MPTGPRGDVPEQAQCQECAGTGNATQPQSSAQPGAAHGEIDQARHEAFRQDLIVHLAPSAPGPELSFDGCGINGPDEYRTRLATFNRTPDFTDAVINRYGNLFANAPAMAAELAQLRKELRQANEDTDIARQVYNNQIKRNEEAVRLIEIAQATEAQLRASHARLLAACKIANRNIGGHDAHGSPTDGIAFSDDDREQIRAAIAQATEEQK